MPDPLYDIYFENVPESKSCSFGVGNLEISTSKF